MTKTYLIRVCPKCESEDMIDIYTGTDGLFTSKRFSHYKCADCNQEFNAKKIIVTINKKKFDYAKHEVIRVITKHVDIKKRKAILEELGL